MAAAATSVLLALAPGPAGATHMACNGSIRSIDTPAATIYLDDRGNGEVWGYLETNGVTDLQSGGTAPLGYTDPCGHADPDTVLF